MRADVGADGRRSVRRARVRGARRGCIARDSIAAREGHSDVLRRSRTDDATSGGGYTSDNVPNSAVLCVRVSKILRVYVCANV